MRRLVQTAWAACALPLLLLSQDKVNQGALVLEDFSKRVAAYVQIHKTARSKIGEPKPTASLKDISRHEHRLAHEIRELRNGAGEGTIFTPEITEQFRHLIGQTMQGSTGTRVQQSLKHAEPVHLPHLRVNSSYPEGIPLQSSPPSFLLNLPALSQELEYRVVGHDLVLRDREANLVVDLIRNVVP